MTSKPAVSRSLAYDDRRDHVLRAGARVISREGYGRATIRQVAVEADMSLAGLYHYFTSKEDLLFLIQFHTFDAILQQLRENLRDDQSPTERLRVMVVNHLRHFLARMNELKVCAREMDSLSGDYFERVRALRQEYLRITLEIIESVRGEAGSSRVEPRLATLYLFGMVNWIHMWYPTDEGMPAEALADQVIALFLDGFLPREAGAATSEKEAHGHV